MFSSHKTSIFMKPDNFSSKSENPFKNNKKTPTNQNPSFSFFLCFFVLGTNISLVLFFGWWWLGKKRGLREERKRGRGREKKKKKRKGEKNKEMG